MKRKSEHFKAIDLIVDVVEYAFIEWLVRHRVFVAFKENYEPVVSPCQTFHDALRVHVRWSFRNPNLGPTKLISTAFSFASTPEGYDFWRKYSDAWERFYLKFQSKL